MATQGQITSPYGNSIRSVCLITGQTTTNGKPSAADSNAGTAGVPVNMISSGVLAGQAGQTPNSGDKDTGLNFTGRASREAVILVKGVSTGGGPSLTLRLWGYSIAMGVWVPVHIGPLASGNEATKGQLNGGNAIANSDGNNAVHAERILNLGLYDRLYLEVVAIAGTNMTVEAWVATARTVAF